MSTGRWLPSVTVWWLPDRFACFQVHELHAECHEQASSCLGSRITLDQYRRSWEQLSLAVCWWEGTAVTGPYTLLYKP